MLLSCMRGSPFWGARFAAPAGARNRWQCQSWVAQEPRAPEFPGNANPEWQTPEIAGSARSGWRDSRKRQKSLALPALSGEGAARHKPLPGELCGFQRNRDNGNDCCCEHENPRCPARLLDGILLLCRLFLIFHRQPPLPDRRALHAVSNSTPRRQFQVHQPSRTRQE